MFGKPCTYILLNVQLLTNWMAHRVKVLAAKSADGSSIPRTHMVIGEMQHFQLSDT